MDEDDIKLNPDEWLRYDEYTVGFMSDDELLEHFEIQGPGPPSANVNLFLPPPPNPGSQQDCIMFSSHFDTCSSVQDPAPSVYPHLHLMSVIVAVCCVVILVSCITIFLIWKRRQKKTRLEHLQYRLSDSGNFDYYPTRRLNKYYSDTSIRNQMEDCGVFYTGSLHPVYEEIPTPVEGEYQLLNSEYSTLPFSETYPIIPENMISLIPRQEYTISKSGFSGSGSKPGFNSGFRGGSRSEFSCSGNKSFTVFQSKSGKPSNARTCQKPRIVAGSGGVFIPRDRVRGGGIRTLDTRLQAPVSCDSLTYQTPHTRINQSDFLPREAWTDFSGCSADWIEGDPLRDSRSRSGASRTSGSRIRSQVKSRDASPNRRRMHSQGREISPACNSLESSDVTISTSSSETYPKSGSNIPEAFSEEKLANLPLPEL